MPMIEYDVTEIEVVTTQKKPSSQEFADRELWRYPVQIAELLLGTSDPEQVIASVTEFAKTYDDTNDQIEYIPGIVKRVWLGSVDRGPGRFRRSFISTSRGWRLSRVAPAWTGIMRTDIMTYPSRVPLDG